MNRNYLILFIFLCFPPCVSHAIAADSLGRLFFTPEQRTQLEVVRAQRDRRAVVETAPVAAAPRPPAPQVVTYSGIVNRSDGRSTVWINGKPVHERDRVKGADEVSVTGVRNDGVLSLTIPQADRRASLRVGQSLDVESGVIEESYRRRVTVAREPARPATALPSRPSDSPAVPAGGVPAPAKPMEPAEVTIADDAIRALRRLRDSQMVPSEAAAADRPGLIQK